MSRKDVLWIASSTGVTLLILSFLTNAGFQLKRPQGEPAARHQATVSAGYIGSQFREIDKEHSSLTISYNLENNTDTDYRLADGPGLVILSRLKSDGSYSQEQAIRLAYPVFLPARQHARLAIEITQRFAWPAEDDPAYLDKLRNWVMQRLENVGEFVLFDQTNHWQLELPSGWQDLQKVGQASD